MMSDVVEAEGKSGDVQVLEANEADCRLPIAR